MAPSPTWEDPVAANEAEQALCAAQNATSDGDPDSANEYMFEAQDEASQAQEDEADGEYEDYEASQMDSGQ